jgi:hypothetical protein
MTSEQTESILCWCFPMCPLDAKNERSKPNMEQYFTFDRLSLIASLMKRYAIDATQAAELADDILN